MTADILIVGGGIGGAVLAELLGRGGKRAVVLEKSTERPAWTRPEILWPHTVQFLFTLLPRETWEREAMLPVRGIEFFNGERFVTGLTPETIAAAQVQPWSTDPNATRELLLALPSFELRRGVEVTEVLKDQGRVVGVRAREIASREEFEVRAPWTVGDDGGNSAVRRACGIEMPLRLFPMEFFCFKFDWPAGFPHATLRVFPNARHARSGIFALGGAPIPKGKGAGMVVVHGRDFAANPAVSESWAAFRATHPVIGELVGSRKFPEDFAHVRRPCGHARRYGAPGALLMGDAAHSVSPAGGQGANMSIADARVLAELLLNNSPQVLEEYERRRRPANERSMRPTLGAAAILGLPSWCRPMWLLSTLGGVARKHPSLARRALRFMSTAFMEDGRA